jgi:hypothetical protein
MKSVIALKFSCLCHSFLAYSAFIIASRWILDLWEVDVDVFELCAEHRKLLYLVEEVYHKSVAVLNHIELGQGEELEVDAATGSQQHQNVKYI